MKKTGVTATTSTGPYSNEGYDRIYQMLFCDNIDFYRTQQVIATVYPWNYLLADTPSLAHLQEVINDSTLETRHKIIACNLMTRLYASAPKKELLGVVIEVAMENGLDVIAAYKDGTARYLNHSEKMIFWDSKTIQSNALIQQLFMAGEKVVDQIGSWEKPRLRFPVIGNVRLSFLVTDGLYFGEGPFNGLYKDPKGRPVIDAAIALMNYLIDQQLGS